jgi:mono/diheme cytochrome c family protein
MKRSLFLALGAAAALSIATAALAAMTPAQQALHAQFVTEAKAADPAFAGFSADRGKVFFRDRHTGGKPDTQVCTECHTTDLTKQGKTRAGKDIEPMAASVNPKRYTDKAEVEKWFKRNCNDVLGRECTLAEKGDVLTYLLGL